MDPADSAGCGVVLEILDRIGDKWTVMVVGVLSEGPVRFNAIQRSIPGLSHRMLTLTLRALERDGLVLRKAYPTSPPKVEYSLTESGRSLLETLRDMAAWVVDNKNDIIKARSAFDSER